MWEALAVILTAASLAATGILSLVKSNNQNALNKQSNEYMQKRQDYMEKRLDELEREVIREMKDIRELMHKIDMKITHNG